MKRFGREIDIRGTASPRAVGLMGIIVALGIGLAHGAAAQAPSQSTATNPLAYEFDVATIMPSRPSPDGGGVAVFGEDTFRARNYTLRGVIRFAYETPIGMNDMLSGGPDWLDSESYDVTAKMDAATADRLTKLSPDERKHTQAGWSKSCWLTA